MINPKHVYKETMQRYVELRQGKLDKFGRNKNPTVFVIEDKKVKRNAKARNFSCNQ